MDTNKDVWVLLEAEDNRISRHSAALLEEGKRLARELEGELHALFLGPPLEGISRAAGSLGAGRLYLHQAGAGEYDPLFYQGGLLKLLKERRPYLLLAVSSSLGSDLLPRLAFKLGAPLVTNCADIELQPDGALQFLRPVQQGRLFAKVRCKGGTTLATFLPDRLPCGEQRPETAQADVLPVAAVPHGKESAIRMTGFRKADHRAIDIADAEVIVAVGRGLGGKEKLFQIQKLADHVQGALGGTRPMVDEGVIPYERQIGQTGKRVSPKLIFLFGISGATEFIQGISQAGSTVAVNIDRRSPVFKSADLGIVGDIDQIIPAILDHLAAVTSSDRAA